MFLLLCLCIDVQGAPEPLKFMEFSMEQTTQGYVLSNLGACVVDLPAPERYAVHKLIVYGKRPVAARVKAKKDLLQAASLVSYFLKNGQADMLNAVWQDTIKRRKGWRLCALQGRAALLRLALDLDQDPLKFEG